MSQLGWQTDYTFRLTRGFAGQLLSAIGQSRVQTFINSVAFTRQVSTITVGTATASTPYTATVNGIAVTFNAGVGATSAQIATGLAAAINANVVIGSAVVADGTSGTTVVLTARFASIVFTLATSNGGVGYVNAATTAAASALAIPYGRFIAVKQANAAYAADPVTQLSPATLPTASTDIIRGVTIAPHTEEKVVLPSGFIITQIKPNAGFSAVAGGVVMVEVETAVTSYSDVFYRHTANGGLNQLGIGASAAGVGLAQFTNARYLAPSFTDDDGRLVAPVQLLTA
jgi:hypothetical protein